MEKKKARKTRPKTVNKFWPLGIGAIVIAAIILLVFASYFDIALPFISKRVSRTIDVALGSVPLIPKTNRQLLFTAIYRNSQIAASSEKFHLSLEAKEQKQNFPLLAFDTKTSFESRKEKDQYAGSFEASLGPRGFLPWLKAETREEDKDFYFYLGSFLPIGPDLHNLYGSWYRVDIAAVESKLKAQTRSDKDLKKDIGKFFESTVDEKNLAQALRKASRTRAKINGTIVEKISLTLSKKEISSLVKKNFNIREAKIDLLIEVKSGYLVAVDADLGMEKEVLKTLKIFESLAAKEADLTLKVSTALERINQDQKFELPKEPAVKVKEKGLLELYEEVQGQKLSDDPFALFKVTKELGEFGSDLITIERLIHVLVLSPTAL